MTERSQACTILHNHRCRRTLLYDAIIVGARCAGSPLAMLLAREGFKVLLMDRDAFPSDIMSTHFVRPEGAGSLAGWGLIGDVLATNCPPILKVTSFDGGGVHVNPFPEVDGRQVIGVCPRRTVLDKILVDAAVAAGAELRERFLLEDLERDAGGRVTGVRGRADGGKTFTEEARIVIGADGLRSKVARLVQPIEYNRVETIFCAYYSYFSGLDLDGVEIHVGKGASLIFPTNDGAACVAAGRPVSYFAEWRTDIEAGYWRTLADIDQRLMERIRSGRREERFVGTADLPHFFRKPYGPGWALVGDSGLHLDPMQGLGISKSFSEVSMLAPALIEGLSGAKPMEEALAAYHEQRDDVWITYTRENLAASCGLSGQTPPVVVPWRETPLAREGVAV